jgi:GT2 family glycosyltransferase
MTSPLVSIVILSYFHPEITNICLRTLQITEDVDYEVVVVDNGSDTETVEALHRHRDAGRITTLIEESNNWLFSEGNNIGVRNTDPESKYILLLNSDVAFMRPDWLTKQLAWMEGTIKYEPSVWNLYPAQPDPGPRDIVSIGWSHDANVEGRARPEGWCCLYRREVWQDMSQDFLWLYGLDEQITLAARAGAKVGVLSQYSTYLIHLEGGSSNGPKAFPDTREPDLTGWYNGVQIETLDFELGPNEHNSYLVW